MNRRWLIVMGILVMAFGLAPKPTPTPVTPPTETAVETTSVPATTVVPPTETTVVPPSVTPSVTPTETTPAPPPSATPGDTSIMITMTPTPYPTPRPPHLDEGEEEWLLPTTGEEPPEKTAEAVYWIVSLSGLVLIGVGLGRKGGVR